MELQKPVFTCCPLTPVCSHNAQGHQFSTRGSLFGDYMYVPGGLGRPGLNPAPLVYESWCSLLEPQLEAAQTPRPPPPSFHWLAPGPRAGPSSQMTERALVMPETQHPETIPEGLRGRTQGPPLRSEATHGPSESSILSTEHREAASTRTHCPPLADSLHPSERSHTAGPGRPQACHIGEPAGSQSFLALSRALLPPGFGHEGRGGLSRQ